MKIIKTALKEDIGRGDITTKLLISPRLKGKAIIIAKEKGIIAGLKVFEQVFQAVNPSLQFMLFKKDGDVFKENETIAEVEGFLKSILIAERVALNFLSRLSGIATFTHKFVEEVEGCRVKIMDTRKTTPGLRDLEKYAVRVGKGFNHRFGLDEMVLIKDNHIKIKVKSQKLKVKSLKKILQETKRKVKRKMEIEIEVSNLEEFKDALEGKPDIIMLDNMSIDDIKKAVVIRKEICNSNSAPKIEVSGGVSLKNIREIAQTGIERISIGALTNKSDWIDFSLEIAS